MRPLQVPEILPPFGAGCGEDEARILWHRVPSALGPGLVRYLWWFAADHVWRWWLGRHHRSASVGE
jgi:hypothetical protein